MLQHGFDPFYQFMGHYVMGHYVMALLYECTATLWISIELSANATPIRGSLLMMHCIVKWNLLQGMHRTRPL